MYYIFNFGSIDQEDEKKYILSIISKLFSEEEIILKERTKDAISKCHEYLRDTFDPSIVSLREMTRFTKCCDFFVISKKRSTYEGTKLINLINKVVEKNINIIAFKNTDKPKQSFEMTKEVYNEHKILKKKNNQFMEIYEFNRGSEGKESSSKFVKLVKEAIDEVANPSYFYLKRLKQLLKNYINNDIEINNKNSYPYYLF